MDKVTVDIYDASSISRLMNNMSIPDFFKESFWHFFRRDKELGHSYSGKGHCFSKDY